MKGMEDDPLALLSLDELFKEIEKRTEAAVLVCLDKENFQGQEEVSGWFHGGFSLAIGLCQRQLWRLREQAEDTDKDSMQDEDD